MFQLVAKCRSLKEPCCAWQATMLETNHPALSWAHQALLRGVPAQSKHGGEAAGAYSSRYRNIHEPRALKSQAALFLHSLSLSLSLSGLFLSTSLSVSLPKMQLIIPSPFNRPDSLCWLAFVSKVPILGLPLFSAFSSLCNTCLLCRALG